MEENVQMFIYFLNWSFCNDLSYPASLHFLPWWTILAENSNLACCWAKKSCKSIRNFFGTCYKLEQKFLNCTHLLGPRGREGTQGKSLVDWKIRWGRKNVIEKAKGYVKEYLVRFFWSTKMNIPYHTYWPWLAHSSARLYGSHNCCKPRINLGLTMDLLGNYMFWPGSEWSTPGA